jgi:hypothetical protein
MHHYQSQRPYNPLLAQVDGQLNRRSHNMENGSQPPHEDVFLSPPMQFRRYPNSQRLDISERDLIVKSVFPGFSWIRCVPSSSTAESVSFGLMARAAQSGLITVLSRVRSQAFFYLSDCTPKHLFVDPAPAFEESPGRLGRHVNIRYSTALWTWLVPIEPT